MASAPIIEGIILVGALVIAGVLMASVMSKSGSIQSAFSTATGATRDAILARADIIYVTNSSSTTVEAWIKNTGAIAIAGPDLPTSSVYFGRLGSMSMVAYGTSGPGPRWEYSLPGGQTVWGPKDTLHVTITLDNQLIRGYMYELMFVQPAGRGGSGGSGGGSSYVFSAGG